MTTEELVLALDIYGNNGGETDSLAALETALGRQTQLDESITFWREINKRMDLDVKFAALEAVARLRTEKGE